MSAENKPINLRTNKLLAAAGSASGAIVWARPVDRSRVDGEWVAVKYYASSVDPDTVKPEDASAAVTELFLYRITNHFLEDGATPHVCKMTESLRHPNAKANLAEEDVLRVIKAKGRKGMAAASVVRSGKEYMILPTFFKPGAISLMDALFPSDGKPALLSERDLALVIFQVLYTIECMVRTGVMHLDVHLGNVMLYPEPADPTKVKAYEYVDWNLRRYVFYVPYYGWEPKIFDFDHGVKHGFPNNTVGGLGVLKQHYAGSVANRFLTEVGLSFLFEPFCRELDPYVDANKFLLHLLTTSGIPAKTRNGTFVTQDSYEWGRRADAFSPVRKWVQLAGLLSRWSSFDSFKTCSSQSFNLSSSVPHEMKARVAGDPRRIQSLYDQTQVSYPRCFSYNYPVTLSEEADPAALQFDCLFPKSSKVDLSKAGAASANNALLDYARYNIADVMDLGARTVIEHYSIQRLFEAPNPPVPGPGQACPQPKLVGPPLQINTAPTSFVDDPMDIDQPDPSFQPMDIDRTDFLEPNADGAVSMSIG